MNLPLNLFTMEPSPLHLSWSYVKRNCFYEDTIRGNELIDDSEAAVNKGKEATKKKRFGQSPDENKTFTLKRESSRVPANMAWKRI